MRTFKSRTQFLLLLAIISAPTLVFGAEPSNNRINEAAKVAKEYESVMLGQMLKQMNQSAMEDPLFKDNQGIKIYKDLTMDEYGKIMAERGGIGMAEQIMRDIKRKEHLQEAQNE